MLNRGLQRLGIPFFVACLIIVLLSTISIGSVRLAFKSDDWVNHTHAVLDEVDSITSALHEGDLGLKSYLLTRDQQAQSTYRDAYKSMAEHLEVIKALTRNESSQEEVVKLERWITKRMGFVRELLASPPDLLERSMHSRAALNLDVESSEEITSLAKSLKEKQKLLLHSLDQTAYFEARTTRLFVVTGVSINVLMLAFAGLLLRSDMALRQETRRIVDLAARGLERRIQEETQHLTSTNSKLTVEGAVRQWANLALAQQVRYSQLIIDSIQDLIFVLSRKLKIVRVNPAVIRATGLDEKVLITAPLSLVVHNRVESNEDPGTFEEVLTKAISEGRDLRDWLVFIIGKDGRQVPFSLNLFPLLEGGGVVGGIVTLRLM